MKEITRRLLLGVSASVALVGYAGGSILFSGTGTVPPPPAPTGISQSGSASPTILANATAGTVLATCTMIGGTQPISTASVVGNTNLTVANITANTFDLVINAGATFTPGTTPTYKLSVTDANSLNFTDLTNRNYIVPAGLTSIAHSPDSILDNAGAGTVASNLAPVGGTAPGTWVITTGLTAFDIVGSGATSALSLKSAAVGTLTPGQTTSANQGTVTYTDAAGLSTSAITVNITVQDHTAQTLIASITAVNTSTTADTPAHANAISFGHPIKDGDLATYPTFQMADGTNIPYSTGQRRAWDSGNNKFACYLLQLPEAIAHNGSGTGQNVLKMLSNGSAPTASALSTTDITTNTDFKMVGTILSSVDTDSGTWTASLNDAITEALASQNNSTIETYANGQAGIWYLVKGNYKQSGVVHGQLRAEWEVQVLPDNTGALSRFRVRCNTTQPFWDVDTPAKGLRVFSALKFQNGATVIRDIAAAWAPGGNPFAFTWSSGNIYSAASAVDIIYGTSLGGYAIQLTTTGTLPNNLATGTTYFLSHSGTSATNFKISTSAIGVPGGSGPFISSSNNGSGTHTMTIYPAVTAFNGIYSCSENAMFDCFDASGNVVADTTVRFKMDTSYWISTKVLLPYQVPATSSSNQANKSKYLPNGAGGKSATGAGGGNGPDQSVGSTGDIPDLGPNPLQNTFHLFTQAAVDEGTVRVNGLTDVAFAFNIRTSVDGRIPAANNGTDGAGTPYAGMSGPYPTFRFGQAINFPGHNPPVGSTLLMTFAEQSNDHMPEWSFYPFLFTGEAAFREQLINRASNALINLSTGASPDVVSKFGIISNGAGVPNLRNLQISGGNTYYGVTICNNISTRAAAWGTRTVAYAAGILADGMIEKTYFMDLVRDTFKFAVDYKNILATGQSFLDTIGIFSMKSTSSSDSHYQRGYRNYAVAIAAGLCQNADALTMASFLAKYYAWINTNMNGVFMASNFVDTNRLAQGGSASSITGITLSPLQVTAPNQNFVVGDYVVVADVGGTTQINGNSYVVSATSGNIISLVNTDGSAVNTTGWGTYTSGGTIGAKFIDNISWYGGTQGVSIAWVNGSQTFTIGSNGMANSNWVNYQVSDGDKFLWPVSSSDGSPVPGGLLRYKDYYAINSNGAAKTCNITSVKGDAGHIVTPNTTATSATPFVLENSPPTNVGYNMGGGATFQIVFGTMMAFKAVGATVDAGLLSNLSAMYAASLAHGNFNPNTNSKYLMVPSY